jgi:hypothetical protein
LNRVLQSETVTLAKIYNALRRGAVGSADACYNWLYLVLYILRQ